MSQLLLRNSLFILALCCGGLVDHSLCATSDVCRIKSTQDSSTGLPAVRLSLSSLSFKLLTFGITMWDDSTQMKEYLLNSDGNCGLTVFIRTNDIDAAGLIRSGMNGRNIDNWRTECQFDNTPIPSANPTISFQKLITAIHSNREGTIPDEWFNGDATIAKLQIPVLPNSKKFGLSCSIQSTFTYNGASVDFSAAMNASIHMAGCPDGKYGSTCSSDCTCAGVAACDAFTGTCTNTNTAQVSESSTTKSTTQEADITSSLPETTETSTGTQEASITPRKPSHVPPKSTDKGTKKQSKKESQDSACMTYQASLWTSAILILFCLLLSSHHTNFV